MTQLFTDKKQLWDAFRFLVAVIFTAGVLYATVQAAVGDIAKIEDRLSTRVVNTDKLHEATDLRLRELENDRARRTEWEKNVTESLQRIERKIERSK